MAATKNPLKGLSREQVLALIDDAGITEDDVEDTGFEIVLRGPDAESILQRIMGKKPRNYDPDSEDDTDDDTDDEEPETPRVGWAEKALYGRKGKAS
jgi:hypothetical protein